MSNQVVQEKKPSLDFRNLTSKSALLELNPTTDSSKREIYETMADKLLDEGFRKNKIALLIITGVESRMKLTLERELDKPIPNEELIHSEHTDDCCDFDEFLDFLKHQYIEKTIKLIFVLHF